VVGFAVDGWGLAAGVDAAAVTQGDGPALGRGEQAAGAAEVEDLAVGAEDGGDHLRVAGQAAQRGGVQGAAVRQ
jgi:hypothetical protein